MVARTVWVVEEGNNKFTRQNIRTHLMGLLARVQGKKWLGHKQHPFSSHISVTKDNIRASCPDPLSMKTKGKL